MITSLRRWLLVAGLLAAPALTMAQGQTLRWAAQNDILTLDPHSQNHATTNNIMSHSYETLVTYDKNYKPQPALATSWSQVNANTMRFNLRRNVKFHDGSPFTADDVIFSYERSKVPPSTMTIYVGGVKEIRKIDDHTIDVVSDGANPVLLNSFTYFFIMNKAWAVKNKTEKVQNYSAKEENYASRNTNGTGPYIIKEWVPDQRVVLTVNKNWWGKIEGNVTDVIYTPIKSDPTRVAALIAGDVDAVTDLPTQDVPRLRNTANLSVLDGPEVRTIFIVMDLGSDELKYGTKGPNPFKDLRVRKALNMSMDRSGIQRSIMRGLSVPGMLLVAPGVNGYSADADKPVSTPQANALATKADRIDGGVVVTGAAYVLQADDNGKVIEFANAGAVAVTLPADLPAGFNAVGCQAGAGKVSLASAAGASLRNRQGFGRSTGQWAEWSMRIRANAGGGAAEWVVSGDLEASA